MRLEHAVKVFAHGTLEDIKFLEDRLIEHNLATTGIRDSEDLTILMRIEGYESITAGLSGWTWGGACEIRYLWVHPRERHKGFGRQLIQKAEHEVWARGCNTILLETFDAQAVIFYQKLGYDVFATVEDCPRGHLKSYMRKSLLWSSLVGQKEEE
jgi:GNAT superfamily N-acetyltransferase